MNRRRFTGESVLALVGVFDDGMAGFIAGRVAQKVSEMI
jgi:hypothetical protein